MRALTVAGADAERPSFPFVPVPPDGPRRARLPRGFAALLRATQDAEAVYATGIYHRAVVAARARGLPIVLKLVNDPAYERARALGIFSGSLEEFQDAGTDPRLRGLTAARTAMATKATKLVVPSRYLARLVEGWSRRIRDVQVIPNPAPEGQVDASREELRRRMRITDPTLVFAGRLVEQKNLPLLVEALRQADGVRLEIIGEGPERSAILRSLDQAGIEGRVRFHSPVPRPKVLEWLRAADAAVLSSDWENHPHAAVEALHVGTPVVATRVGGVPEIVDDGVTGALVAPGDAVALADAIKRVTDATENARLRAGISRASPMASAQESYRRLEAILLGSIRD